MKIKKIVYWSSTILISLMMLSSAWGYFTNPDMKGAFVHLGFPDYFRIELGTAKFLGVLALLIPMIPVRIKEFAYFGFTITFISAIIAHLSSGDPIMAVVFPLVAQVLLTVSYIYFILITDKKMTMQETGN